MPTPPAFAAAVVPNWGKCRLIVSNSDAGAESFGANYKFTDNPYNLVGFSQRSYNSFNEAAAEAGNSRLYDGLHYRKTTEVSLLQGQVLANNVARKLTFKK